VGDVEKRPDPHDVVADVVVEPIVASGGRTIVGGEKFPVIGRRIDDPQVALKLALLAVFINDRIPTVAIVGRLDQRKSEVAQRALVLGEIGERYRRAGARCRLLADPSVNVIGNGRLLDVPQIAEA